MEWKQVSSVIWSWDTEKNSSLEGQLIAVAPVDVGEFGPCNSYQVITEEIGRVSCICGTAFDKMFDHSGISLGDMVKIQYQGKKSLKDGRQVNMFKLYQGTEGGTKENAKKHKG